MMDTIGKQTLPREKAQSKEVEEDEDGKSRVKHQDAVIGLL